MLYVDRGNFIEIPVYNKELKRVITIKNTRFNPDIHEMLGQEITNVKTMHEGPAIVTSEQLTSSVTPSDSIQVEVGEPEDLKAEITYEAAPEVVITPPEKKKRGMPKGGWPKKANKTQKK